MITISIGQGGEMGGSEQTTMRREFTMIKATMLCTNCKEEKEIPYEELESALELDKRNELNLCSECRNLWTDEMSKFREDRNKKFAELQLRFGIVPRS